MIFDVLKSTVSFSHYDKGGTRSLKLEVVPQRRECLDIGDKHILAAAGYLPMRDKEREPVSATVVISSGSNDLDWVKGQKPICGVASFHPRRTNALGEGEPSTLTINVVVESDMLQRMMSLNIAEPGAATLHTKIEGLEFGWEPDGSHQIWDLNDESDCEYGFRRRVTSFWFNADTFATTEQAIHDAEQRRLNEWLAASPDPEDRKLAAANPPADPVASLLRHCRALLVALLVLGTLAFLRSVR